MIVDLKHLSEAERNLLLYQAGNRLEHVSFPNVHPDRPASQHFYEVKIKEDLLNAARRRHINRQQRKQKKDEILARRAAEEENRRRSKTRNPVRGRGSSHQSNNGRKHPSHK